MGLSREVAHFFSLVLPALLVGCEVGCEVDCEVDCEVGCEVGCKVQFGGSRRRCYCR